MNTYLGEEEREHDNEICHPRIHSVIHRHIGRHYRK